MDSLLFYRIGRALRRIGLTPLARLCDLLGIVLFSAYVPSTATIGRHTKLAYGGLGVVIHHRAAIGCNVMIASGVTIGGRSKHVEVPVIEDDVYIGSGAKILGPIRIGRGSVIGANAVVVDDVPARSVVAGIPAKVVRTDIDVRDYVDLPYAGRQGSVAR